MDRIDVYAAIRLNYHSLSEVQRRIADYVLENGSQVMFHSITGLASECATSETTIMRFLRKIGFDSYQVFRVRLAQGLQQDNPRYAFSDIKKNDTISEIREKVISSTVTAMEDIRSLIPDESLERAVKMILCAGRVFIFGVGSSAYIAGDLFHKLIRLGLNAGVSHDPHIMAIQSAQATPGDLLVCVSHSGESEVILESTRIAKDRGASVLVLTSYPRSSLSKISDVQLLSSTSETSYRPDAMTSRILQLVIIDLVTIAITLKLGKTGIDAVARSQVAVAQQKR